MASPNHLLLEATDWAYDPLRASLSDRGYLSLGRMLAERPAKASGRGRAPYRHGFSHPREEGTLGGMADQTYLVTFRDRGVLSEVVKASDVQMHGDHLSFVDADGKLSGTVPDGAGTELDRAASVTCCCYCRYYAPSYLGETVAMRLPMAYLCKEMRS